MLRLPAAGRAAADPVDQGVALLDLRVELGGVALEYDEAAAALGQVGAGRQLVGARRLDGQQAATLAVLVQATEIAGVGLVAAVRIGAAGRVARANVDPLGTGLDHAAPGRALVGRALFVAGTGLLLLRGAALAIDDDPGPGDLHLGRATSTRRAPGDEIEELLDLGAGQLHLADAVVEGEDVEHLLDGDGSGHQVGADAGGVRQREVGLDAESPPHGARDQVAEGGVAATGSKAPRAVRRVADEQVEIDQRFEPLAVGLEHLGHRAIHRQVAGDGRDRVLMARDLEAVERIVGELEVTGLIAQQHVEPSQVLAERARVGQEHVPGVALALGRVAVGVLERNVVLARRVDPGAIGNDLRGLEHDVVVTAEHDVDAGGPPDHLLIGAEAEVSHEDDHIDQGPEQVDVGLGDVDGLEGRDAQATGPLVERRQARQVAHADHADLEASQIEGGEGLKHGLQPRTHRVVRIVQQVVGREHRVVRPLEELGARVQRALVELVVGDHLRVDAHGAQRADLRFAVVVVEDRRALKAVPAIDVQHPVALGAFAGNSRRNAGDAADGRDGVGRAETKRGVVLRDLQGIGEEPRMDVRGVQQRELGLPVQLHRGGVLGTARERRRADQREHEGQKGSPAHRRLAISKGAVACQDLVLVDQIAEARGQPPVHPFLDLPSGRHGQGAFGDGLGLGARKSTDGHLDRRDRRGGERERANAQPHQEHRCHRIAGHRPADAHRPPLSITGLHHAPDQAQDGRVERRGEVSEIRAAPIDGERVLDEIVGSDAEEISFTCQLVGHDDCARDLHHHSERHALAAGMTGSVDVYGRPVEQLANGTELRDAGDHRHHDLHGSVGRGAQHRAELGEKKLGSRQAQTHRAQAQRRVHVRGNLKGRTELVAADVEGPQGHRSRGNGFDHATVDRILLVLTRRLAAIDEEKLRAIEPDALGAVLDSRGSLRGQLDVGHQLDAESAAALRRAIAFDQHGAGQLLSVALRGRAFRQPFAGRAPR